MYVLDNEDPGRVRERAYVKVYLFLAPAFIPVF